MNLQTLAKKIDGQLIGDKTLTITNVAELNVATPNDITFCLEKKYISTAEKSNAGVLITFTKCNVQNQIIVKNPRKALAQTINLFSPSRRPSFGPAISTESTIDSSVTIGHFVVIEKNSYINKNTIIHSHTSIGTNCSIGQNCVIESNVTIQPNTTIGDNTHIHSGTVIGTDGFGFYNENEEWFRIPHIGSVTIGQNVEIGANCVIDRGCLGETIIDDGTKIDNLVHIAHNSKIGKNCAIAAQVGCLGGAILEDCVQIGGQTGIAKVVVGHHSIITSRAGVTKTLPAHSVASGFPAWDHKKEIKKEIFIRKNIK